MSRHDPARRPRRPRRNSPDRPLSERQRSAWHEHIPLVRLQIGRTPHVSQKRYIYRDADDLFQEGCIALGRAIRKYKPKRHGQFAPYALARIHAGLYRLLCEDDGGIRIPLTSRRREKLRARERRHDPSLPRIVPTAEEDRDTECWRRRLDTSYRGLQPVLYHLAHDRYVALARRTAAEMARAARGPADRTHLIMRCLEERWLIIEPEGRTSFRDLARRLKCSLGRIVHYESTFKLRLSLAVREDPLIHWLMTRADDEDGLGLRRALDPDEVAEYEAREKQAAESDAACVVREDDCTASLD